MKFRDLLNLMPFALLLSLTFSGRPLQAEESPKLMKLLDEHCAMCHGKNGTKPKKGVNLTKAESIKEYKKAIIKAITQGTMPPRKPDFATTKEGRDLLKLLKK